MARQPLRIALYSGLFVRHDAISNSLRHKLDVLTAMENAGLPVQTTVLTQVSDYSDPRVRVVKGAFQALGIPEAKKADVHIFEFGIFYDLFDAVFMVPPESVSLGIYHNVTPLSLVAGENPGGRFERSFLQKHNLSRLDHVACVSEFNLEDLVEFGLARERLSVLHLPAPLLDHERPAKRAGRATDDVVGLMFLGRFVRSKGVYDLLAAVSALIDSGLHGFHLALAGNSALSDPEVLETVRRACRDEKLGQVVSVAENPSDDELLAMYESADAFVMPSYHEGFGVPIIEALSAGCYAIAYNSGNLPHVLGGLGTLVPTGDVRALAAAIGDHVERVRTSRIGGGALMLAPSSGSMSEGAWRAAVAAHLEGYSHAGYRRAFLELLRLTSTGLPGGTPDWLAGVSLEPVMQQDHDHGIHRRQYL